ncbi:hypothetical protein IV203_005507 [Nitzschia inconspicua]|uniref:Uncharacterized protein n=1 Tax=Nitzschia inconspicua TaxID=303405 RepID=A0A9K3PIS6_9STRA|nr:hypothetical protein IV203_005507 [Nitzschia inconspicua]
MKLSNNSIATRNRRTSRYTNMKFLLACVAVALGHGICAFQLSMVASRAPFGPPTTGTSSASRIPNNRYTTNRRQPATTVTKPNNSVTSTLISNLACMALKRRLKDQTLVTCDLTTDSNSLLMGRVGPVTVKGRSWRSSLGLTCRAIEATVDECRLDMGRIITKQKLVLTTPAEGCAMVALSAADFGNFITHPLMVPPNPPRVEGVPMTGQLEFLKDDVRINAAQASVVFYGTFAGAKWEFTLQRSQSGKRALITVAFADGQERRSGMDYHQVAQALTDSTSHFFNEMVFELDGTFLSFNDMMVTDKGKEPSVMLSLMITVRKFPSPGLEF